jgi:hypothetical protein
MEICQFGRTVACQPVLLEVSSGALHIHLFPGRKFSADPIEGGSAGLDVPFVPQLKHLREMVTSNAVHGDLRYFLELHELEVIVFPYLRFRICCSAASQSCWAWPS